MSVLAVVTAKVARPQLALEGSNQKRLDSWRFARNAPATPGRSSDCCFPHLL